MLAAASPSRSLRSAHLDELHHSVIALRAPMALEHRDRAGEHRQLIRRHGSGAAGRRGLSQVVGEAPAGGVNACLRLPRGFLALQRIESLLLLLMRLLALVIQPLVRRLELANQLLLLQGERAGVGKGARASGAGTGSGRELTVCRRSDS